MPDNKKQDDASNDTRLPRLLADGPAPKDEFGSHERIARGIASLINNQGGGHVIGLRGPFGSGKSTTVAELEKQLPPNEWSVVTFDAWTHRGHELMRAFLASIIEQLSEQIGVEQAKQKREAVINQQEIQYTTAQSTINGWGQALVAIGIFATVVTAGLRATDAFGNGVFGISVPVSLLLWLGWLPWIALLLIVLIGFIGPWPKPTTDDRKLVSWLNKHRFPRFLVNWCQRGGFSLRIFQEGEHTRTTVTNSGAANSITFQQKFSEIVELALDGTERRLIVVLDNMDRLDEDDQLVAWSTVQAFVDAKFPLKGRVWYVLPLSYGDAQRKDVSARLKTDEPRENYEENVNLGVKAAELREKLADKMFLTEFRVPELILTDWVAYVRTLCQKVLANVDGGTRESVQRVIVSWQRQNGDRPTPRQLRAIINQVGGLYHQWRNEVPLDVIALYVVKIQDVESKAERLTDKKIVADFRGVPGRNAIRRDDIRRELAMLHFSAHREKALQVLVHGSFSKAMTTGQALSSDELAIPHVETLIEHVVRDILKDPTPGSTILRMAACLGKAHFDGIRNIKSTWTLLVDRFSSTKELWHFADDETLEEGAEQLAPHFHDRSTFEDAVSSQIGHCLMLSLSTEVQEDDDAEKVPRIVEFWRTLRGRLTLDAKLPVSPNANQMHMLLLHLETNDIHTYDLDISAEDIAETVSIAMTERVVPIALVEALDYLGPSFADDLVADWPTQVISVIDNPEASLEAKVSVCDLVLLYGPDSKRTTILDHIPKVLDGPEVTGLPERTQLAIGLFGALTGQCLTDEESGAQVEYLSYDTLNAAVELLNRWKLRGRLWNQVRTSEAGEMRDALLRSFHETYPTAHYAGVVPKQFNAAEIPNLEHRVGRSVLIHLAAQPDPKAWTQYISNLDLGAGQLPLLDLVMEAQEDAKHAIIEIANVKLGQVNQATFINNLVQREDGYASLFDLELHGVEIVWPTAFFGAAAEVLIKKGWIFKSSNIPGSQREKILAGVWSKMVSGQVNVPTLLLQDHIGPYVQSQYKCGGREEFTEKVLPTMIRRKSPANLTWAVDFLFARHRLKSTIPETSDAMIQAAITQAYPGSQGVAKEQIERLTRKGWFSLPPRPGA